MPAVLHRVLVVLLAAVLLVGALSTEAAATEPAAVAATQVATDTGEWVWPLAPEPEVMRAFDLPDSPWLPGHRGVDLLGQQAQRVLSIGAGTVSFAGTIAGRGVVVVTHGALRSTYEPVTASVSVGATVTAGAMIGMLQSVRSHCLPSVCLHLGLKRGDAYLDPLLLLGPRPVRIKPGSTTPARAVVAATEPALTRTTPTTEALAPGRGSAGEPPRSPLAVGLSLVAGVGLAAGGWSLASSRRLHARG